MGYVGVAALVAYALFDPSSPVGPVGQFYVVVTALVFCGLVAYHLYNLYPNLLFKLIALIALSFLLAAMWPFVLTDLFYKYAFPRLSMAK